MYYKKLYLAVFALVVLQGYVDGKKTKKNKRPKHENEDTTPQPSVISYSTFGFNDVGSYDGFVPSSPDYASFLSNINQEATTRLYAPAFPTAMDSVGFNANYESLSQGSDTDGQLFNEDGVPQSSMLQYSQSPVNFFNTPSFESSDHSKNTASDDMHGRIIDELNAPVYGTKINSRNKNNPGNQFNNTEFNTFNKEDTHPTEDKYFNFHDVQPTNENKPSFGESNFNYQNSYMSTYPTTEFEDYVKSSQGNNHGGYKFPKVIDFTKSKPYYPTGSDSNKFEMVTPKPLSTYGSVTNIETDSSYNNLFDDFKNKPLNPTPTLKNTYDFKTVYNNQEEPEKNVIKANDNHDFSYNFASSSLSKNNIPSLKSNLQRKKKIKNKPWISGNYTSEDYKKWKDPFTPKGYEYATNYSSTSFKYDVSEPKKPFQQNIDEIVPASSNIVDLPHYPFPEAEYSSFKNTPYYKIQDDDDYSALLSFKDKYKVNDYGNEYKNLFSTVPTTTSYWGNSLKTSDFTSFKKHPKKSQYNDDINDDVVNIPKRPNKITLGKPFENHPSSWFNPNQRPYKLFKPQNDWPQEISSNNRYKTEEDLLDLRNHDTSHPSYLPTYKLNNDGVSQDNDFKKVVDKWRQSYLKSKYKNLATRDYESYASDTKPYHVPVPKPFPIEIPHPVIIPVPQPYPVRVPVAKPVAVPVVTELKVPIEKPVPYPVYKKVPYPVEKLIPVRVEKEVQVPIEKPYPVPVPYVRPVFHHTRPSHDEYESDHGDEEGYRHRPDSSKKFSQYRKRPSSRNRTRRPSRNTIYQERNRRRWPDRHRPSGFNKEQRFARPSSHEHQPSSPYKHHSIDPERYEDDRSDYFSYCRTTGNC